MNEPSGRTTLAVLLLNLGLLLFVVHDALGKVLTARYPIFEIIFVRSAFALPLVLLFLRWEQGCESACKNDPLSGVIGVEK